MKMSVEPTAGAARLLPLSGAAAVALVVVSFAGLGGNTPGSGDSAAKISAYYDSHEVREMIAAFALAASAPLFVIFGVILALSLWQAADGRRPLWQGTLALGSAVAGVGFLIGALIHVALTQTANNSGVSGGALQALAGLDESSWVAFNSGLGVMMLGAAGALLASKAHPVLGWIALVAGVALFIPGADFVALIVSGLWIITTSVRLFRASGMGSFARQPELA
jgi:uncharacterized BrkB/YihY/UPF0761 family membrane protein